MTKQIVLCALALIGMVLSFVTGYSFDKNSWNCAAEDEVVIINNTCVHIDTLNQPERF